MMITYSTGAILNWNTVFRIKSKHEKGRCRLPALFPTPHTCTLPNPTHLHFSPILHFPQSPTPAFFPIPHTCTFPNHPHLHFPQPHIPAFSPTTHTCTFPNPTYLHFPQHPHLHFSQPHIPALSPITHTCSIFNPLHLLSLHTPLLPPPYTHLLPPHPHTHTCTPPHTHTPVLPPPSPPSPPPPPPRHTHLLFPNTIHSTSMSYGHKSSSSFALNPFLALRPPFDVQEECFPSDYLTSHGILLQFRFFLYSHVEPVSLNAHIWLAKLLSETILWRRKKNSLAGKGLNQLLACRWGVHRKEEST